MVRFQLSCCRKNLSLMTVFQRFLHCGLINETGVFFMVHMGMGQYL